MTVGEFITVYPTGKPRPGRIQPQLPAQREHREPRPRQGRLQPHHQAGQARRLWVHKRGQLSTAHNGAHRGHPTATTGGSSTENRETGTSHRRTYPLVAVRPAFFAIRLRCPRRRHGREEPRPWSSHGPTPASTAGPRLFVALTDSRYRRPMVATGRFDRWRSPRTAPTSPQPVKTALCGSGIPLPARCGPPSRATLLGCGAWRSPQTARTSPQPAKTTLCGSGIPLPARCGPPSQATPDRCGAWRSPRTADTLPRRAKTTPYESGTQLTSDAPFGLTARCLQSPGLPTPLA